MRLFYIISAHQTLSTVLEIIFAPRLEGSLGWEAKCKDYMTTWNKCFAYVIVLYMIYDTAM